MNTEIYTSVEAIQVQALEISNIPGMDPIRVFMQDKGTGRGRIVIETSGQAWSCYWNAMGVRTVREFFVHCDFDYLVRALYPPTLKYTFKPAGFLTRVVREVQRTLQETND